MISPILKVFKVGFFYSNFDMTGTLSHFRDSDSDINFCLPSQLRSTLKEKRIMICFLGRAMLSGEANVRVSNSVFCCTETFYGNVLRKRLTATLILSIHRCFLNVIYI